MRRLLLGLVCAVLVAGCGSENSTATSNNGAGNLPASSGSTPTTAARPGSGGAQLVVTGSVSASVSETSSSANMCSAGPGGTFSAILAFDTYSLQFDIPSGTTHFPSTPSPGAIAFFNNNDSTREWSIGTAHSSAASGTVTLSTDGKSGTVDVDMLPDPPEPNPSLQPIHVKGTFTCT